MENNLTLMRNFNKGKKKAFKVVYEHFRIDILCFANRLINDHHQSEEITQDSFLKLYTKCSDFKTFSNIKYFLYAITRNACYDLLQKNKTGESRLGVVVSLSEYGEAYNIPAPASDIPSWQIIETELLTEIKAQIEKLPADCRNIFKMRFYDDKSVTEIANELGVTKATVSIQLKRAKEKLRRSIIIVLTLGLLIRTLLNFFTK